jgi:predicted histone-like DNA-binding protein
MSIVYKKTRRVSPLDPSQPGKYYPQLVTMGRRMTKEKIIYMMKDKSSLSAGDIESVTTNFIDIIGNSLLEGYSVHIPRLGLFSLSAKSEGSYTEELCTPKKIKSIHVNFRPAANLRPNLAATRAEDKIEFIDLVSYIKTLSLTGIDLSELGLGTSGEQTGDEAGEGMDEGSDAGSGGDAGGGGSFVDPNA